jgi:simple sugar transport system permease protein
VPDAIKTSPVLTPHDATRVVLADSAKDPGAFPETKASTGTARIVRRLLLRPEAGGFVSAVIVFLVFAILAGTKGFLGELGTADWIDAASQLGIIALPVGLLMMAGEYDLSVGSVVGATSITVAICHGYYALSPWIGVAIAFIVAGIIGFVNGMIVVKTKLPSFIVTLAMMLMVAGGALGISNLITQASNITATPSGVARVLFASSWNAFDISVVWWVLLVGVTTYLLQRTRFGNWIYATGGNLQTARLAGVPTNRVKVSLFIASSSGAALVGIIETLTYSNGNVTLGANYVFSAIAAAVIGGVLLSGGYGSTVGIVFGSVTYGVVSLGVFFLGWDADLTQLFVGLFLLLAVLANNKLRQLAMGKR